MTYNTMTIDSTKAPPSSSFHSPPKSARSLGRGVSFGDNVALDSFDGSDDCFYISDGEAATRTSFSSSQQSNNDAVPSAPTPSRVRVLQPSLSGEACHSFASLEEEEKMIHFMWERLTEVEREQLADASMLTRHLRAEKGKLEKALTKCQAALKWRDDFGLNHMENWGELLRRENATGKIYVRGYDAEGRALMYMRSARENTHNEVDNMRHLVWNLEKAIACTRKKSMELGAKRPLEKINLVIDYEGFSLRNAPPMSTSKFTLDVLQKHYPERMFRAYCVNAPSVFKTFWMLIKPWIDPSTKEKIVFITSEDCQELVEVVARVNKLEPVIGGPSTAREFDSEEYLSLPFDVSFDEFIEI